MSNGKYAMGEVGSREVYQVLVGNPEGKRRLDKLRRKREEDVKVYVNKQGASKWTEFKDPGTSFIYLTLYLAAQPMQT
jgi:hypothetical protein